MTILVSKVSAEEWEVVVDAPSRTVHNVTLTEADRVRLGGVDCEAGALIRRSFEFLLDREPNTSILHAFSLPVIGEYFPEYERWIATAAGGK